MRTTRQFLMIPMVAAALLLTTCNQPVSEPPQGTPGTGTVRVAVDLQSGKGAPAASVSSLLVPTDLPDRTIYPTLPTESGLYYKYTFTPSLGTAQVFTPVPGTDSFILAVGDYTLAVEAYLETGRTTLLGTGVGKAGGNTTIPITNGQTTSVDVALTPVTGSGNGTRSITISYPDVAGTTLDTLTWGGTDILSLLSTTADGGVKTATLSAGADNVNLITPAGSYLLTASLTDAAGKKAGRQEAVHIYAGLPTTVGGADWTFAATNFTTDLGRATITITWSPDGTALSTNAPTGPIILSRSATGYPQGLDIEETANVSGDTYAWTVNSVVPDTADVTNGGRTLTFDATWQSNGVYTIGLAVTRDGKKYSTIITVEVQD